MTEGNEIDWDKLEDDFDQTSGDINDPQPSANVRVYNQDIMAKHMLWNVVPCYMAEDVARAMGMTIASDDVEKMEHDEAHARLGAAAPLAPLVEALSVHGTRAAFMATLVKAEVEGEHREEMFEEITGKMTPIFAQTIYSIISEMVDLGAIQFPNITYSEGHE